MSERESIKEVFFKLTESGTLGIYPDGGVRVVWDGSVRVKEDLFCAVDEHLRQIQRSMGLPVTHEGRTFVADGELGQITEAATNVSRTVAKSLQGQAGPLELAETVEQGDRALGIKPRNQKKVAARAVAREALDQLSPLALQVLGSEYASLGFARSTELTRINAAVIVRTKILVAWIDNNTKPFMRLSEKAGAALDEFNRAKTEGRPISDERVEYWIDSLLNPSGGFANLGKIKGNPFQQLARRPEILKLGDMREIYSGGGVEAVRQAWFNAKQVLSNHIAEWKRRNELDPFRVKNE